MIYLLLGIFSVSISLWWSTGASGPVYLILAGMFVYLWAAVGDLALVYRHLSHIVSGNGAQGESTVWTPLTDIGARVIELLDLTRYRLNAVRWALESHDIRELDIDATTLPIQSSPQDQELPEVRWYRDCIVRAHESFRAEAISVVFNRRISGERGVSREVVSHGVQGRRFNSYVCRFLAPYFERLDGSIFGLRDGINSDSLLGEFSVFGFRYTISFPFQHSDVDGDFSGVLWLGYRPETIPTEVEISRARDLANRFGKELASSRRIAELRGAVARAELASQERADFIAQISHDIRSPLSNIRSILSVLKLENFGSDSTDLVNVALTNCDSVGEIVADILDYARHQSGKLEAKREDFDLAAAVRQVTDGFRVAADSKGVRLVIDDLCFDTQCIIHADSHHVRRALTNVVSNALKYTVNGSVAIELEVSSGHGTVIVRDTGRGMSAEELESIFTPFNRATSSHGIDGVGLGCPVTKILCELNHGSVTATSELGVGSVFRLSFPCADPNLFSEKMKTFERRMTALESEALSGENPERVHVKVLVVDDDTECALTLSRMIARVGFSVHTATTVGDAISIFNYEPPDVVVTDSNMPAGGARRLIEFMAQKHPETHVAVVSGSSDISARRSFDEQMQQSPGAYRWFLKPAALEELVHWIDLSVLSFKALRSNVTYSNYKK